MTTATHFNFRTLPNPPRAEAWRALDAAVARWVLAHGGSRLLAEVAGWASYAEGQGDSALLLEPETPSRHGLRALSVDELAAVAAEPMVTVLTADEPADTPFVLQFNHFYLRRNALHEIAVAADLRARRSQAEAPLMPCTAADLQALFAASDTEAVRPQTQAVLQVLGRRLFVLTGGPGTGKTTTVLRMLLALTREHHARHARLPVIRLAAPTGKAARRLGDALREGVKVLHDRTEFRDSPWPQWLAPAQQAEAMTVHRLLGSRGQQRGFMHHAGNPIGADVVLIDEASMLDLPLLRALLDALPSSAVLVFVGDAEQLPPVGTGSVFLDLVRALEVSAAGDVVRLQHSFRADKALVPVNAALRDGSMEAFAQACEAAGSRVQRQNCVTLPQLQVCVQQWHQQLFAEWRDAGIDAPVQPQDLPKVLRAVRGRQLLCALREGPFGAEQVNARLETLFRQSAGERAAGAWYPGRAVMITHNDAASGLFNGDIGICLRDAAGHLQVWFEGASAREDDHGPRAFSPDALPPHEGAFAITVHKSQGSEYGHVAVLLPPDADNAVLSRQLLYTAATRARTSLALWCSESVLQATLAARNARSSALPQRLA
ncbi:MAG: exodeoxyribonuclease V subunit alpha [Arenimonas sp.]